MRISVFYDHIRQAHEQTGIAVEQLLDEVKQTGIDCVELNYTLAAESNVLEMLHNAGLAVSCLYEFYDLPNADERAHLDAHIALAQTLGAKTLVVPGFLDDTDAATMAPLVHDRTALNDFLDSNAAAQRMCEGLRYAVQRGKEHGVCVTIEDFDDKKSTISNINGLLWHFDRIPGLRMCFDMGNFITFDEDDLNAYRSLSAYVSHVHCKDRNAHGDSVAAGTGVMPETAILRQLKTSGYDDVLAIEHFDVPNQRDDMMRSARFLRDTWRSV